MQRIFTDSITAKLVSTDKTTKAVQENWNKKRGKRFKACTYQEGSERDKIINLPTHNENKDRSSKKRKSQKKEEANSVTEAKKSLSPLPKTQKQKKEKYDIKNKDMDQTKDFTEIDIESTSVASATKNDSLKLIVLSMIKGLPSNKNTCLFNAVMVTAINPIGSHKALDLPNSRLALLWKHFCPRFNSQYFLKILG